MLKVTAADKVKLKQNYIHHTYRLTRCVTAGWGSLTACMVDLLAACKLRFVQCPGVNTVMCSAVKTALRGLDPVDYYCDALKWNMLFDLERAAEQVAGWARRQTGHRH
jgi:hypothetical protein